MFGFKVGENPDGFKIGHPVRLFFELLVDENRKTGNLAGSGVLLEDPVGLGLIHNMHGILQLLGCVFGGFGGKDGFHSRSDFILFRGITGRTGFGAADIFDRRLDDRHVSSKIFFSGSLKRRHIVNEGADSVNHGSITPV